MHPPGDRPTPAYDRRVLRRFADLLGQLRRADRARHPVGTVPGLRRPQPVPPPVPQHSHRPGQGVPPPSAGPDGLAVHAHDYDGPVRVEYEPAPDGHPDPGEVVWTWVPYEEDTSVGKDRPVVVLGRALQAPGRELAVVMLSSKEHPGDPRWLEIGAGPWDAEGRPSSVRTDRVLAVATGAVRREGGTLDRERFEQVAAAVSPPAAGR
jgi:mRNA-degrading endonuclease toxin of MazEF toxin-antitoxin module